MADHSKEFVSINKNSGIRDVEPNMEDDMENQIYERLRQKLDQYGVGFPNAESGIEMQILKELFEHEEAALFMFLDLKPQTAESIAKCSKQNSGTVEEILDQMFEKGLVFSRREKDVARFAALPFAPGIFEQQSETMDGTLASLFEGYYKEVFHKNFTETEPVLIHRPIPVNREIDVSYPMAIYDHSREIVRNQNLIAVTRCICRVQKGILDDNCDKPVETCLMFGSQAQYYMDRGTGRQINTDEALEILDMCEDAGLVTMPFNTQAPANICNCCSDCCVVLGTLKKHPRPAEAIKPNFHAFVNRDLCEACETCLERCPMDAIHVERDDAAKIDRNRCIGCGLCVNVCPPQAIQLIQKPRNERVTPPETGMHMFMEIARRRGVSMSISRQ